VVAGWRSYHRGHQQPDEYGADEDNDKSEEENVGLTEQFLTKSLLQHQYFADDFCESGTYHMNPYWAMHVLAPLKRIRFILVFTQSINQQKQVTWSVTTFDGSTGDRVVLTRINDITECADLNRHCLADIEFHQVPTIQILYQHHGFSKTSTSIFSS
jgi:hypothetical protein